MKNISLQEAVTIVKSIQPSGKEEKSLPVVNDRRIRKVTYYVAGLSADLANNAGEVLYSNILKAVGITNFDNGGVLGKGKYFLATGIRILFDTTVTDPKLALWANVAPVAWKNGELQIGQDGQPTLFETPITDVTNFHASTSNDDDFTSVEFLLQPQKPVSIRATTAGSPASSVYKIEIRGYEFFNA